jgi:hypothetical protein
MRSEKEEIHYFVLEHPRRPGEKLIAYLDRMRKQIVIREEVEGIFAPLDELPLIYSFPDPEYSDRTIFPHHVEIREGPISSWRPSDISVALHYQRTIQGMNREGSSEEAVMDESIAIPFEQYERLKALFSEESLPWEESYNEQTE